MQPTDRLIAQQHAQQILDVDHADDVIEIALVDRVARVRRAAQKLADLIRRGPKRNADDPDPRNHRLAGRQIAELEQFLQHLT